MGTSSIPRHQVGYGWLPWALGSFLAHLGDCIIALSCRGFPGPVVKNSPANAEGAGGARDTGSLPGSGRSPGVENGNPLRYACLENSTDRGAWWATQSMGSQESQTQLSEVTPISLRHPGPQQPPLFPAAAGLPGRPGKRSLTYRERPMSHPLVEWATELQLPEFLGSR